MHLSAPDGCVRIEMSISRIEVPLALQPPHFDDDATIATARQVVPIKGARRIGGGRKVFTLLPLLIASTLCGALGAIAVNYFDERQETAASVTQQPAVPNVSTQAKTEPAPVSLEPELNAQNTDIHTSVQTEGALVAAETAVDTATEPPSKSDAPKIAKREDYEPKSTAPAPAKRESTEDAAKLVRKRRVHAADSEVPLRRSRRNDAGRIEDLFTGPNP